MSETVVMTNQGGKVFPTLYLFVQFVGGCAILFCVIYALRYISRYGVNVPHNDDWNYISQYQNFLAGKLNYFDLMTLQDSGYRQPTLRLFWYPLLALSHVDMQVILVGHVGLILACLMGVFLIYRSISPKINLLAFAPVALLMFGTGQSEGLLWAGTTPYFLANLGVVFALALIGRSQTKYFVLGLIAAVFANYSYGNGFWCGH